MKEENKKMTNLSSHINCSLFYLFISNLCGIDISYLFLIYLELAEVPISKENDKFNMNSIK